MRTGYVRSGGVAVVLFAAAWAALTPASATVGVGTEVSARNGEITFIRKGNFYDEGILYSVNTDGTKVRRLLKSGWIRDAAWSPDGKWLAIVDKCAIKAIPAAGGRIRTLVKPRRFRDSSGRGWTECYAGLNWAPDARRLVFMRCGNQLCPGEGGALYVVEASGRGLRQLTQPECLPGRTFTCLQDSSPDWSPDGKTIMFTRLDSSLPDPLNGNWANHARLYTVNADGSGLVARPQSPAWSPKWSPDGTRIAFKRTIYHKPPPGATNTQSIVVMNADGSGERTLMQFDTREPLCSGWSGLSFEWSPDGTKFAVSGACPPGVSVMNPEGSDRIRATRGSDRVVSWRPLR